MAEERQVCDTSTTAAERLACKCRRDSLEIMEEWVTMRRWVAKIGRWVVKLVARLLITPALRVLIQTSLKNIKWATYAKEWPTHSGRPKKYTKNYAKMTQWLKHSSPYYHSFEVILFSANNAQTKNKWPSPCKTCAWDPR
jgi:hypothetical protein